jgi:predicted Zn-dependent protease
MELCFLRATESIDADRMQQVAEDTASALGVHQTVILEPFGDYSPDVILPRLSDLRERYLDDQATASIFVLFDENAVESHGAIVLGRALAQSRVAVVRWRTQPETTAATCLHELGHILGLTNRHCEREECVMYPYARERSLQGKNGSQLFCEECWRTITNDTLYESLRDASKATVKRFAKAFSRVGNTIKTSGRTMKPQILGGAVNPPAAFPETQNFSDEHSFLHAVLRYYGFGVAHEEADA